MCFVICLVTYSDNLISYYFDLNNTEVDSVGEEVLFQLSVHDSQALELKGDIGPAVPATPTGSLFGKSTRSGLREVREQ